MNNQHSRLRLAPTLSDRGGRPEVSGRSSISLDDSHSRASAQHRIVGGRMFNVPSGLRSTARRAARVLPPAPSAETSAYDPSLHAEWQQLVFDTARQIALQAGKDPAVLRAAVGPRIEVGANLTARMLLQLAEMIASSADQESIEMAGLTGEIATWLGGTHAA